MKRVSAEPYAWPVAHGQGWGSRVSATEGRLEEGGAGFSADCSPDCGGFKAGTALGGCSQTGVVLKYSLTTFETMMHEGHTPAWVAH